MATEETLRRGHGKLDEIDIRLTKISNAIKTLADNTPKENLVDKILAQARKEGDDAMDKKLRPVRQQLKDVDASQHDLKKKIEGQQSVVRLESPGRILALIRGEIRLAEANPPRNIPAATLVDYKNAVQYLPTSTNDYWQTAAAIINYESLLHQLAGSAPDPTKVAGPCIRVANQNVTFSDGIARQCVFDLDRAQARFENYVFQDSVIRIHGGSTSLHNVRFINCRFVLDLPVQGPPTPPQQKVIMAILSAPDQKSITISSSD
jgi:hypothetical protein